MLVQGIDLMGISAFSPQWDEAFMQLSDTEMQDLAGNTINVNCITCIVALAFALLRPRDTSLPACVLPSTQSEEGTQAETISSKRPRHQ